MDGLKRKKKACVIINYYSDYVVQASLMCLNPSQTEGATLNALSSQTQSDFSLIVETYFS